MHIIKTNFQKSHEENFEWLHQILVRGILTYIDKSIPIHRDCNLALEWGKTSINQMMAHFTDGCVPTGINDLNGLCSIHHNC